MSDDVTIPRETFLMLMEYAQRAEAFAGIVAACVQLGHDNPGATLDYVHGVEPGSPKAWAVDYTAWVARRPARAPGCEERLRDWGAEEARIRAARLSQAMGGAAS